MTTTTTTLRFTEIQNAIHAKASALNTSRSLSLGHPLTAEGVADQIATVRSLIKARALELMTLENSLVDLENAIADGSLAEYREHIANQG